MAGTGPQDLQDFAEALLAASVDSLDAIPAFAPGLAGSPDRSFVSPGEPVADCCELLAVHATALSEAATEPGGLATGRRFVTARLNHASFVVTIFRCVPTGVESKTGKYTPPLTADLEQAASQINADGWALWNGLFNRTRSGDLIGMCSEFFMDGMRALVPSGGCAGWVLGIRVALEGYEEVIA